jgi:hypothetical protein
MSTFCQPHHGILVHENVNEQSSSLLEPRTDLALKHIGN